MAKLKIVADHKIPFLRGVLEPYADVIYVPGKDISRELIRDADALVIRTRTVCNESLLMGSKVRFIATATIGYDHIDTAWCERNDIQWANAPGCNSSSVMQYIASALVTLKLLQKEDIEGKVLGVIGVGHVGSKVAMLGKILGMHVLLNDPPRARKEGMDGFTSLDDLLKNSDIVTLHVPLEKHGPDATWHMADAAFFEKVKKGAWFINSSRGAVTDNKALLGAINKNKLRATVLDVWEGEPVIDHELLSRVTIATPHIAGYSADGKAAGTAMAVQSLARFFSLPLTSWYPETMPPPAHPVIDLQGVPVKEQLAVAILHTYSILEDNDRLRLSPETFEVQRENYPVRREFPAYTVKNYMPDREHEDKFRKLGFLI